MPTAPPRIVLASGSPRRRDLLGRLGVPFAVVASYADESLPPGTAPEAAVIRLAERKARAVAASGRVPPGALVLAADTTVALDGELLGKPADNAESAAMLRRLLGRGHEVWTGVALLDPATGATRSAAVRSRVVMRRAADAEVAAYLATGEGRDKAGAYGIQGAAGAFVERVEGCWNNVVGLPLCAVADLLAAAGVPVSPAGPACTLPDGTACPRAVSSRVTVSAG